MDKPEFNVFSGMPILHSKDKKEVCYLGKSKTKDFKTITIIYTRTFKPTRALTEIFNSRKMTFNFERMAGGGLIIVGVTLDQKSKFRMIPDTCCSNTKSTSGLN
jgi:hypothetical protein